MNSKIREALHMTTQPVACYKNLTPPVGAMEWPKDRRACVVSALAAAAKGRCAALQASTVGCYGGRCGLGFETPNPAFLGSFLSEGTSGMPGIRQKETPALGAVYAETLPPLEIPAFLVFQPLDQVPEEISPACVVFLVNPDQLSGLVTLANFDRSKEDNVQLRFGAGCAQAVRYALCSSEGGKDTCFVGLTDPSARLHIQKDLLSFSIPYPRFLEMESKVAQSFLAGESWQKICQRI
jgi:hypothetical protein